VSATGSSNDLTLNSASGNTLSGPVPGTFRQNIPIGD
jgi:hypothetical protein